jgi:hypothetical protein
MAKTRRVVRKVEPSGPRYFDEQVWPIQIALVVLSGFLMGVSLAFQPLGGVPWHRSAWPSLIGIPLVAAAAMVALARIDNRLFRRSLQLSLVMCAIVHVAMVVQMLQTHLVAGRFQKEQVVAEFVERRPPKIVPEYHPTQLVPEEDRPRQDFDKPIPAESPEPTPEPERIVRQSTEQDATPAQPQPVPVPEERRTTEPNVVNRQVPNEVAPRLAAQTSRLSRQMQPSKSRQSQPVEVPSATPQSVAKAEPQPTATSVTREKSESVAKLREQSAPTVASANRESQIARQLNESVPSAETRASKAIRRAATQPAETKTTQIALAEARPMPQAQLSEVQPRSISPSRQQVSSTVTQRKADASSLSETAVTASSSTTGANVARADSTPSPSGEQSAKLAALPRREVSSPTATDSKVASESLATSSTTSTAGESTAQPSRLALQRAEAGISGGRRSPNFDTSAAGGSSPALSASSAARRADSTQQNPTGAALAPAAPAKMARSRAGGEVPTATVKAEQLASATAPGATQVAELTASSGANVSRADAAARHEAVTAAKGSGEIDFGPTQIVAETGSGRASGGGQPELNFQSSPTAPARRALASSGPPTSDAKVAVGAAPPVASDGENRPTEAAPVAVATGRTAAAGASSQPIAKVGPPSATSSAVPVSEAPSAKASGRRDEPAANPSASAETSPSTGPVVRKAAPLAAGGETNVAEIPEIGPRSAVAQAEQDHAAPNAAIAALARSRSEALPVDIVAPTGPGGLGSAFTPEVGIQSRQARTDSLNVELRASRFLRSEVGGLPAVSTAAIVPAEAYSSRAARVRGQERAGGSGSNSPQTEEAIERGLAFLARYQAVGGGWSLQGFPEGASLASDTAATALAVLAFQGAGYNHREFQYRDVVQGGIAQLIKGQKQNGDLFIPLDDESNRSVWLYSHSLAAIALCEAYGMTQDAELREPAQKAIDFIVSGQHAERGGWRYSPGVGADTSVTGWMMMALKSGELAGLDVPPATYRKIARWLDDAQQSRSEPHLYRYNPFAPDTAEQRHGRTASKTMTAVGLLMRLYTGWKRDNPNMVRGAAFLAENLPASGTTRQPERDTYYWYYATQVMAHVGDEPWQAWMARLHPLLVDSQIRQGPYGGSWDPQAPIADRWGPQAGRIYVTTMNLLSLEVQYRKLPLYGDVSR